MTYGGDEGSEIDFATARGRDWPSVRQFNVYLMNGDEEDQLELYGRDIIPALKSVESTAIA